MYKQETFDILDKIRPIYKTVFNSYSQEEYKSLVSTWTTVFENYKADIVSQAVDEFIQSKSAFPPTPGQILAIIRKNEQKACIEAQRQKAYEKPELSESTKQLLAELGKDESALDTEFDLLCREAYLRGLKKQK